MSRSCMCSMNKAAAWAAFLLLTVPPLSGFLPEAWAQEKVRDPVTLRVVTVNPSSEKTQTVPVRIDLPAEVTPKDVLEVGELGLEYDEDRGIYYVHKPEVELAPKETRVFEVVVQDLWFVPEERLGSLRKYTQIVLGKLKGTEYKDSATDLANTIFMRLDEIAAQQADDTLSRKTRIGNYRRAGITIAQIKEDLARMEKLLSFTGGPPVPEMLEESKLKSDAPSRTTTWGVIFLILLFLGLLAGQFFFTWNRRAKVTEDSSAIREAVMNLLDKSEEGGNVTQTEGTQTDAERIRKESSGK